MTDSALKVFVVDDDPSARMIATHVLSNLGYTLAEFSNGADCLAALDQEPDVILLDVEMPGTNGIDVCRACRDQGLSNAQVIFLSAHDDLDTRMAAYDAGGNDYVVKPYAAAELARKVKVAERALETARGLSAQANFAQQAAFTAMSSMGEMGAVLEFLRNSFACRTPADLARALFAACAQYGLQGLAEMRDAQGAHCFSSTRDVCSELEASIVGHAREMGRVFQFSDRLAINSPHLTMLLLNMPLDDPDRNGRYRDHLAIISEGAEARLEAMDSENQRLAHANAIMQVVADLAEVLARIELKQRDLRVGTLDLASRYAYELHAAFGEMALTGSQESALVAIAHKAHDRIANLMSDDKTVGNSLRQVIAVLEHTLAEAGERETQPEQK
jgi:CheY-like chemotaxis protein